jgi:hypothetical protein
MYTIQASASLAAAATTTTSSFPFDVGDIIIASVLNGGVPPTSNCQVALQLSVDNVNWVTVDTRDSCLTPNQAFYNAFKLADYSGASLYRSPNFLARLAGSSSGVTMWAYFRLVFTGNPDQAVTIQANGSLTDQRYAQLDLVGSSLTSGGGIAAWTPPEGGPVIINNLVVYCTANSNGAANLSVGVAANATTNSVTLINASAIGGAANSIIVSGTGTSATAQGLLTTTQSVTFTGSATTVGFAGKAIITYTLPSP